MCFVDARAETAAFDRCVYPRLTAVGTKMRSIIRDRSGSTGGVSGPVPLGLNGQFVRRNGPNPTADVNLVYGAVTRDRFDVCWCDRSATLRYTSYPTIHPLSLPLDLHGIAVITPKPDLNQSRSSLSLSLSLSGVRRAFDP